MCLGWPVWLHFTDRFSAHQVLVALEIVRTPALTITVSVSQACRSRIIDSRSTPRSNRDRFTGNSHLVASTSSRRTAAMTSLLPDNAPTLSAAAAGHDPGDQLSLENSFHVFVAPSSTRPCRPRSLGRELISARRTPRRAAADVKARLPAASHRGSPEGFSRRAASCFPAAQSRRNLKALQLWHRSPLRRSPLRPRHPCRGRWSETSPVAACCHPFSFTPSSHLSGERQFVSAMSTPGRQGSGPRRLSSGSPLQHSPSVPQSTTSLYMFR